jgi:hypothetical protein
VAGKQKQHAQFCKECMPMLVTASKKLYGFHFVLTFSNCSSFLSFSHRVFDPNCSEEGTKEVDVLVVSGINCIYTLSNSNASLIVFGLTDVDQLTFAHEFFLVHSKDVRVWANKHRKDLHEYWN